MTNEKTYRIEIDPRILELLGPSLYTNIYYILAELIANAYDANAKNVYIIQQNDRLVVEDDGTGMSYDEGDIDKFLNVAVETRTSNQQAFVEGSNRTRRKMGRKGVGKLAALSVSHDVRILTARNGEKSGFVLSRTVPADHSLRAIPEEEITFEKVNGNGTSIVMCNPQYKLHKTLPAVKNNLLKIFPLVDHNFRIHIINGNKVCIIDSFEEEIIQALGGLIVVGDRFEFLTKSFSSGLKDHKTLDKNLIVRIPMYEKVLKGLVRRDGERADFLLAIEGWTGIYRTSKGKKDDPSDFPDNFLSLLSNRKMGEYNILPSIGKNSLNEVYIVGQLHIDLFEDSDLPDMALSNRQGYKSDDDRYQEVIKFARDDLLPKAINLRGKYGSYARDEKNLTKDKKDRAREEDLKKQVNEFKRNAAIAATKKIIAAIEGSPDDVKAIEETIEKAISLHLPDMGLKRAVDEAKKKLLISHAAKDKVVADFVYNMAVFNNVPPEEIIYTSSENVESRIPLKHDIFGYLREFFVESSSSEKIMVVYVTSDDLAVSWSALSEVGAGWITKSNHDIFNINKFTPKKPLDVDCVWANVEKDDKDVVFLSAIEADVICEKIILMSNTLGFGSKEKALVAREIRRLANVKD